MRPLDNEEISLLEDGMSHMVYIFTHDSIDIIFSKLIKEGYNPEKRLAAIANQDKRADDLWLGDYKGLEFMLWGGLGRSALLNIFSALIHRTGSSCLAGCIIEYWAIVLKRAMEEDKRVDLLVRSVVSGVRTLGGEFDRTEQTALRVLGL